MSQIEAALRKAIKEGHMTRYALWKMTDIDQSQLSRFMHGRSGLSIAAAERLAAALGLQIVVEKAKPAKSKEQ